MDIERQLALLTADDPGTSFAARMDEIGLHPLAADGLAILQMNITRRCNLSDYMQSLRQAFNPAAAANVMCRTTLSVGWDGRLYDCDFNQMLGLSVNSGAPAHIRDFDFDKLRSRQIAVREHCFACTAGAGSSCQGALEP